MIRTGEFLEWAEIVGHRSGTPRQFVEQQRRAGRDVILEIDVKGAQQVRDQAPDALLIFLMPPSFEELERRLRSRGTEDRATDRGTPSAPPGGSSSRRGWFDHVVVNDDLDRATEEVAAIIEGSRTR